MHVDSKSKNRAKVKRFVRKNNRGANLRNDLRRE